MGIEFSASKLSTSCFLSLIHFIVILSGSIITLPSVSFVINSPISDNSYTLDVLSEYDIGVFVHSRTTNIR